MTDIKRAIVTIRELHKLLLDDFYDQPIKSDKWKILVFLNDGVSFVVHALFVSESLAKRHIIDVMHFNVVNFPLKIIEEIYPKYRRFFRDFSHAFPIPVNKE